MTAPRPIFRCASAALLGCLFAFAWWTPRAQAQTKPTTFSLNWVRDEGAESCISSQALAQKLTDIMGNVLVSSAEAEHALEGFVRRTSAPETWQVDIRVSDAQGRVVGERKLVSSAATCSALEPSLLLVLALTLDPEATLPSELLSQLGTVTDPGTSLLAELEAAPPASTTDPLAMDEPQTSELAQSTGAAPTPQGDLSSPSPDATPEPRSRVQRELMVAGALGAGMQPAPSPGVSLDARLGKAGRFWIASTSVYWLASETRARATGRDDEVVFRAFQTALTACIPFLTPRGRLEFGLCGGASVGVRWVQARALDQHSNPARPYGGPVASAEMHYRWAERWFLSAAVAGARFWPRDRFGYQDSLGRDQLLYRPAAVSVWGALGVGHRF